MASGRQPTSASFWLLGAPDSLAAQSHRESDGTGLGWIDDRGDPHVSKQPLAAYEDARFAREAREVRARHFIAHVRFASTGGLNLHNTHPFEQQRRLFAHNGVLEGLPQLEQHLGEDMQHVKGDTDSERLFALITRETADHAGDVGAGIEAACRWVAANLPLLAINLLLIDEHGLWALRYPDTHPLYLLEREPGEPLEHSSSLGSHVHCGDGVSMPLVVLASERMDDDTGWRMLRSGELMRIDGDLKVSGRQILHGPPAHPLTLADLAPHARASQEHAPGQ
jgi:glutamine amidotransferase